MFHIFVYFTLILISVIYSVIFFGNVLIPVTEGGNTQLSHVFVLPVLLFVYALLLDHEFFFIIRLKAWCGHVVQSCLYIG